jgi:hypothetical protein
MENRGQRTNQGDETRAKISEAINTFYETHGYSPSIREIGKLTGIKSTSTVHGHLRVLKGEDKRSVKPRVEERKRGEASMEKILIAYLPPGKTSGGRWAEVLIFVGKVKELGYILLWCSLYLSSFILILYLGYWAFNKKDSSLLFHLIT